MKKVLGSLLREEKGQALPIALILLALGSLIIYPLVSLTHTSLASGRLEESRMYENYAANAGISDGLRQLIIDSPSLPAVGNNWIYTIPDTNDRQVTVTVNHIDATTWRIDGTATSGDGYSTIINCFVEEQRYLSNAINTTSVTVSQDAVVNGNVQWDSSGLFKNFGTINGDIIDRAIEWPTIEEVDALYLAQIQDAPVHEGNLTLMLGPETLADPYSLGPIYINGDLHIEWTSGAAVRLDGLVYVDGSVDIESGNIVYMNNNTIFCQADFWMSETATTHEYGSIVSRPSLSFDSICDPNAYLTLWSVEDVVEVGAQGTVLYGSAYSPLDISIKRGATINYMEPPPGLALPPLPGKTFNITAWQSTTQ